MTHDDRLCWPSGYYRTHQAICTFSSTARHGDSRAHQNIQIAYGTVHTRTCFFSFPVTAFSHFLLYRSALAACRLAQKDSSSRKFARPTHMLSTFQVVRERHHRIYHHDHVRIYILYCHCSGCCYLKAIA